MPDDLLDTARVARLATADQYAKPHVVPVIFVWLGGNLYAPLDAKPARDDDWHALRGVRNIETNGRVSIVLDRWDEVRSYVLLDGLATILESGPERDAALAALSAKYPGRGGAPSGARPVVRVAVERITRGGAAAAAES